MVSLSGVLILKRHFRLQHGQVWPRDDIKGRRAHPVRQLTTFAVNQYQSSKPPKMKCIVLLCLVCLVTIQFSEAGSHEGKGSKSKGKGKDKSKGVFLCCVCVTSSNNLLRYPYPFCHIRAWANHFELMSWFVTIPSIVCPLFVKWPLFHVNFSFTLPLFPFRVNILEIR